RFNRRTLYEFVNWVNNQGNPFWIEDPLSTDFEDDFQKVRNQFPLIRWAAGESVLSLTELWNYLNHRSVDIIMSDVKHIGGVSAIRSIFSIAEERGLMVSLHNPSCPISTAFSAHLTAL